MLHCLGPTVQRIFSTLPGENTTLAATKDALDGYFAPKRNVVAERYKFRSRAQQPEESIDPYLTALRELAKSCDFAALEEGMVSLCLNDDTTNWRRGWDQRPNRREMSLEIAEAEITAAGEPGPPKDDETRTKRREHRTGDTSTVEGQPRRPNRD